MNWSSITGALTGLALVALPSLAQAAPRDPSGVWLTEDGKARIRVEKCGPQNTNICGYAVWLKVPLNDEGKPRVDFRNPDPKKQTRPSLGHQMIMGLKPNADGRYEGKIYNAENGKFYDVTIWSEAQGELNVKGCMLGFLCGSQTWEQKADVAPGQLTGPTNGVNGPRADAEWAPKGNTNVANAAGTPSTTGTATKAPKPAAAKPAATKSAAPAPQAEQPED
ncbi:DUF2147 domain-containing protein [Methylobacterium gnaphalii]|uniref:DUF2147 domain-containing protein n=1 Tax=Methylobacterium gnaphalii TaxID=1010610 RepID=A0A512JK07_9HYPH|nr:DUF2147 domain-containing protein [Methylobacterium gnaphalii]GEP10284.1 hypothetical protein MGN01_21290 [Methylobacterium gnaphalii]GJD68638.1 hypothetical protein MMMDOFMJ_1562 [Methylobacterium gnaphalii]GLS49775.1 hypothetical protein GCM10007885_26250 [Methylobacterium gnaphalii]